MINDKREKPVRIKPVAEEQIRTKQAAAKPIKTKPFMIKLSINKQAKSRKELSFMEIEKTMLKIFTFFCRFHKGIIPAVSLIFMLVLSGCSGLSGEEGKNLGSENSGQILEGEHETPSASDDRDVPYEVLRLCGDFYEKAAAENKPDDPETVRSIVNRLGEKGYTAVDHKNQIDMTEPWRVIGFCEKAEKKEEGELTVIEVNDSGGFSWYDLRTRDGEVDVVKSCYRYENGEMKKVFEGSYIADSWEYTKEGYFMFSGVYFSEEQYVLTLSEGEEHAAFRVQPLDEKCRELNRRYLLSVGYKKNNLFLEDWSEEDFGNLDFYDLYDLFYEKVKGKSVPYTMDDDLGTGAVYQIPQNEFEQVIMAYFNIDKETLRSKTVYDSENETYEYKPRGFYETEYFEYPYPEVVGYEENEDGTVTLTANVVFPYEGISKVYAHEVVVRPMEDGSVQYVSNRVIPSENNYEETWHTPRLTEEEWKRLYGDKESGTGASGTREGTANGELKESPGEGAKECLLTEEEKKQLQDQAMEAAGTVKEVYQDKETADTSEFGGINNFTDKECQEAAALLGRAGYISVAENCNMENPEGIEDFYSAYLQKRDAMFTIFDVNYDGGIGAFTFIYRKGRLQTYYVGIGFKEGGEPWIRSTLVSDVEEIKLTQKGYFIYAYEELIPHSTLRQYWRIKPLSDRCRELTKKYITGLSYVNYNMLVTNWDADNVEDILMPCMFEDIYRIHTGKVFRTADREIPAGLYEEIMTAYFPVSIEKLRKRCGYNEKTDSYPYEMIFASPYPPFGEVVDYKENKDGTITLTVDGVWPDYNSDCAFTNRIVVKPFADGTFRYLSNSIEKKEMDIPVVAEMMDSRVSTVTETTDRDMEAWEKGYDLPVNSREKKEAEADCKRAMELVSDIYVRADKGQSSNAALSDETLFEMQGRIVETGRPVSVPVLYSDMGNYRRMDRFLKRCLNGKSGSIVAYRVCSDGGIGRNKYIFDGEDMYILSTKGMWDERNEFRLCDISCHRIREWSYTEKGWFGYEVCVPEPPEVTEIVDGACLIKISPMPEEWRRLSLQCLGGIGYQGNNLLCSDWDEEHMEDLDYSGIYEYLYGMKYGERFYCESASLRIPREEFESLIMEYLPVTAEELQKYAAFHEEDGTYEWAGLGCSNYAPTFFGTSVPQVVGVKKNEDGSLTLTVDAVCDMVFYDDAVITHELTVGFAEDGSFRYLGNKILYGGLEDIPDYQYRISKTREIQS